MKLGFSLKFGEAFAKCLGPETEQQPDIRFIHIVKNQGCLVEYFQGRLYRT
jgi:hypothetical protein